jgi:hypothetical protein
VAAHGGRDKTIRYLTTDYWWPSLYKDVVSFLEKCPECQQFKRAKKIIQPMGERPIPRRVWERIHMDIWSPGGSSSKQNKYVIAFVDTVSKYLVAVPVRSKTAETVARVFAEKVVITYGPPEVLYSDGAAEFRSRVVGELYRIFGITRRITTPYRPQANGQIERVFATLRPMLAAITTEDPRKWDQLLPYVVYAYNTSYHRSIRNTPFYLMFGRDPSLGSYGLEGVLNDDSYHTNEVRMENLKRAREIALVHINQEAVKRKEYYDSKAKPTTFVEGDIVMLKSIRPPKIQAGKLFPWYVGPFRVVRVIDDKILGVVPVGYPVATVRHIHSDRARLSNGDCTPSGAKHLLLSPFADMAEIDANLEEEADD